MKDIYRWIRCNPGISEEYYFDRMYDIAAYREWTKTAERAETVPDEPELNKETLIKLGFDVWRQFDDPFYRGVAAETAYFFFLASIPSIIVFSQILGIFDVSMDVVREWVSSHLGEKMSSTLNEVLSVDTIGFANIPMMVLAVWAASSLEFSLARLSSHILTDGKYRVRFVMERLKAIPTAFLSILASAFALVIFVYGEEIILRVFKDSFIADLLVFMRLPLLILLFFAMILLNYYILPRVRVPVAAVLPGAIVASAGIVIATVIYSVYIQYAPKYNVLYGAFASVVALMFWFYIISWVVCIGMMFNKSWDRVMKRNLLTQRRIVEYLAEQRTNNDLEKAYKYLLMDDDEGEETDSLAVKMSKRFVKGYAEERERERARKNLRNW